MKINILAVLFCIILVSCSKEKKQDIDNPNKGEITIEVDESFQSVTEALTERYMALNPQTKINLVVKKEDLALLDFFERKIRVVVLSRELSAKGSFSALAWICCTWKGASETRLWAS